MKLTPYEIYKYSIERLKRIDRVMDSVKRPYFFLIYRKHQKFILLSKCPKTIQMYRDLNTPNIIIPSKAKRHEIIENIFGGEFDVYKHQLYTFHADKVFANQNGNLSNGTIGTLADYLTIECSMTIEPTDLFVVSAKFQINVFTSVKVGEDIYLKCEVQKRGKRLIFMAFRVFDMEYKLIAQGTHVIAFLTSVSGKRSGRHGGKKHFQEMKPKL